MAWPRLPAALSMAITQVMRLIDNELSEPYSIFTYRQATSCAAGQPVVNNLPFYCCPPPMTKIMLESIPPNAAWPGWCLQAAADVWSRAY